MLGKKISSALPGITTQRVTTTIDLITKTVYGKIQVGQANNIYDNLFNDEKTRSSIINNILVPPNIDLSENTDSNAISER